MYGYRSHDEGYRTSVRAVTFLSSFVAFRLDHVVVLFFSFVLFKFHVIYFQGFFSRNYY